MKFRTLSLSLLSTVFFIACNSSTSSDPIIDDPVVEDSVAVLDSQTVELLPYTLSYTAIGASDAIGMGASVAQKGYVYQLRDSLREYIEEVPFENLGVAGFVASEMVEYTLNPAVESQADIVTIWVGGNDFVEHLENYFRHQSILSVRDFRAEIVTLLSTLESESPTSQVYIGDLPDMTQLPAIQEYIGSDTSSPQYQAASDIVDSINVAIAEEADRYGAHLVKLSSKANFTADPLNISDDGFHPNDQGYGEMTELFWASILSDLVAAHQP